MKAVLLWGALLAVITGATLATIEHAYDSKMSAQLEHDQCKRTGERRVEALYNVFFDQTGGMYPYRVGAIPILSVYERWDCERTGESIWIIR